MAKLDIQDIKGLGKVGKGYSNFLDQIKILREAGAKYPISVRDASYMRLHGGSKDGTRTCHAPIHAKKSLVILAMISPLVRKLGMAKQAVEAHRNGDYFVTPDTKIYDKYAEIAEKDKNKAPKKRRAIFLPSKQNFTIQKGDETAQSFFKDTMNEYFDRFARSWGINFYLINKKFVDNQKGTIINYLWLGGAYDGSVLVGNGRVLNNGTGTFGVLEKTSEAGLQKIDKSILENKIKDLFVSVELPSGEIIYSPKKGKRKLVKSIFS